MATPLDPKQVVSFEELLKSQVIEEDVLTQLLVEKRISGKGERLFNEIEVLIEYNLIRST